jgi:hypothetical protein
VAACQVSSPLSEWFGWLDESNVTSQALHWVSCSPQCSSLLPVAQGPYSSLTKLSRTRTHDVRRICGSPATLTAGSTVARCEPARRPTLGKVAD